jgi:hypothetical protein
MKRFSSIQKELAIAGVPKRIFRTQEARALENILDDNENIIGCIQGLYSEGFGLVVATNARLLIVNKSFLWTRIEDESYAMVNSVLYKRGVILGKLTLSTRARQYIFTVLVKDPINSFISIIDNKMRKHSQSRM